MLYLFIYATKTQNSLCSSGATFSTVIRIRSGRSGDRGSITCWWRPFPVFQNFQMALGTIRPPGNCVQWYSLGI